jgi:hypothetical protein
MRKAVRELLVAQAALTAVIPAERWLQLGAVIDVPLKPFAILRWISPVSGDARGTWAHQFQVAIHDHRGSYSRIDALLGGPHQAGPSVYTVMSGIMGYTGTDGYVMQADFLGNSGDDVDIDYKTNTKYSSWQIAGRSF